MSDQSFGYSGKNAESSAGKNVTPTVKSISIINYINFIFNREYAENSTTRNHNFFQGGRRVDWKC